jgi:hypothetical protein
MDTFLSDEVPIVIDNLNLSIDYSRGQNNSDQWLRLYELWYVPIKAGVDLQN